MRKVAAGYEEKSEYYHLLLPVRIAKLSFPANTANIFYLHWHQEFEYFLVTKGSAVFSVEDREYHVHEGECIFVNSNLLHACRGVEDQECEFTAVVFYDTILAETKQDPFYRKYVHPVLKQTRIFTEIYKQDVPWQKEVVDLLYALHQIPADQLEDRELILKSKILEIWHLCYHHPYQIKAERKPGAQETRLKPVINYIEQHYMYDIDLDTLAALLPMSTGQFCRVFKQQMHMTPIAYVMRYRILQSCRLLAETDKKIAEIANLTGFNNISYFNKTFQSMIGCTPSVYRSGEHTDLIH